MEIFEVKIPTISHFQFYEYVLDILIKCLEKYRVETSDFDFVMRAGFYENEDFDECVIEKVSFTPLKSMLEKELFLSDIKISRSGNSLVLRKRKYLTLEKFKNLEELDTHIKNNDLQYSP